MPRSAVLVAFLTAVLAGCGESRRSVAEEYVRSVEAKDWKRACEVSVRTSMRACTKLLSDVYGLQGTAPPTVEQTEQVLVDRDGRKLVHFEFTVIR
jgi:hypothetical protein